MSNNTVRLPEIGSWRASTHQFSDRELNAIRAAEITQRPLLVRGEPGLGKSQIARAIAAKKKWPLITAVINARTEIEDLLYKVDHVARFSDANLSAEQVPDKGKLPDNNPANGNTGGSRKTSDPRNIADYIIHGPIWRALALSCGESLRYMDDCQPQQVPDQSDEESGYYPLQDGCVLLLDEIDKAPADVPNALLEVLNSGQFLVNETGATRKGVKEKVFVVVTSNSERNLPAAFLRRCAVLQLTLGSKPAERLFQIADAHRRFADAHGCSGSLLAVLSDKTIQFVANYVIDYREQLDSSGYRPGTSEFLDLLAVIAQTQKSKGLSDSDLAEEVEQMGEFIIKKSFAADTLL